MKRALRTTSVLSPLSHHVARRLAGYSQDKPAASRFCSPASYQLLHGTLFVLATVDDPVETHLEEPALVFWRVRVRACV